MLQCRSFKGRKATQSRPHEQKGPLSPSNKRQAIWKSMKVPPVYLEPALGYQNLGLQKRTNSDLAERLGTI